MGPIHNPTSLIPQSAAPTISTGNGVWRLIEGKLRKVMCCLPGGRRATAPLEQLSNQKDVVMKGRARVIPSNGSAHHILSGGSIINGRRLDSQGQPVNPRSHRRQPSMVNVMKDISSSHVSMKSRLPTIPEEES